MHKLGIMVPKHHLAYGYVGIGLKMYVLWLCVFIVLRINLLNNDTGTRKGKDMWFMISCSKCSSQIDDLNDEWDQLIIDDPCSWHKVLTMAY